MFSLLGSQACFSLRPLSTPRHIASVLSKARFCPLETLLCFHRPGAMRPHNFDVIMMKNHLILVVATGLLLASSAKEVPVDAALKAELYDSGITTSANLGHQERMEV